LKICPAKYKTFFNLDAKNQPVVFTKQSVVFINTLYKQSQSSLESVRIERFTHNVYTGSLFTKKLHPIPMGIPLCNQQQITNYTHTKEVILNPSRAFTSFGYNTTQIRTSFDSVQHQIFTEIQNKERKE